MKAGWKTVIVAGVALALLSGQAMAQPWGGGPGRGQGQFQGPGMGGAGPMAQAWGPQGGRGAGRGQGWFQGPGMRGAGPMAQAWGPQGGRGAGRGPRAGQGGAGAWCPLGMDRGTMRGLLGRRLNLTPEQRQKIQEITEQARSRVQSVIREVLTEEQRQQIQQMRDRAGQLDRPMQRPGAGVQGSRMGVRGQGMRGPMDVRGQGQAGRTGPRGQGRPGMQSQDSEMRPGMSQRPTPPLAGRPGAGMRGQGMGPAWQDGAPPLERLFDRADANNDGALTRDEFKAFHDTMRGDGQSPQ